MLETISLLGVMVSRVNPHSACKQILQWIKEKQRIYVCVAPVSTLVDCQRIAGYRKIINQAAMVTPDGVPVVWLAQLKGAKGIARTYGPDLMRLTCDLGQNLGLRHFFYGGTPQTLIQLQNCLRAMYPKIEITGVYAPGFYSQVQQESDEVLRLINESRSDILWIGLGSPKQDFWMNIHRSLLNVPVMIGSGAAFDFISGVKPEAPRWMQRTGLGWFFRLCSEPKRLWRRYLIGNTLFVYYVIKDLFSRKQ
jgi:N-acetylglucosaminyldiphosphoundecaprenol N-acetyl-beta-D-mannosaminyltransferase